MKQMYKNQIASSEIIFLHYINDDGNRGLQFTTFVLKTHVEHNTMRPNLFSNRKYFNLYIAMI